MALPPVEAGTAHGCQSEKGCEGLSLSKLDFRAMAQVAVSVGVNVQPGQRLMIMAPIDAAPLVRQVAEAAYAVGAKSVRSWFADDILDKVTLQRAPEAGLKDFPHWLAEGFAQEAAEGAAFLSVVGSDPDLLADVPPERTAMAMNAAQEAMAAFREHIMASRVAWSIVSVPTAAWAKKVFPGLSEDRAIDQLWQAICKASRIEGADPVGNWKMHVAHLQQRADWLNSLEIDRLHYRAKGTDLTIGLPPTHLWAAGGQANAAGTQYVANIPTEEVFTLPDRLRVDGTVRSTKPLSHAGQVIEGIRLEFKDGRITSYAADRALDNLKELIETDDGSHYLGEVSLVPVDSPISQSGTLFYNTLFDENASCHLAIGRAYPFTLRDAQDVTSDEVFMGKGGNVSLTHVDFMVGAQDLDIDATTRGGKSIPIFRAGGWAQPL